ncbi:capsid assembly scaffolding protein Gp46 family protein [Lacticaseibacillus mingshuiensis]|uniref:capsid assembly scaffolding protein Gp46 family protein n=1 Tax=Lacticaseibacillus mingshuiensis TaxID=2799574 RepID=UPI00194F6B04|nr:DUF4355 domain-containing protein [Lacticaseibacillus mingshuiensis]
MAEEATETETNEEVDETETQPGAQDAGQEQTDTDDKSAKILEKLQKRIGSEQAKKNDYKDQLDEALATIDKLKKGENPDEPAAKDEKDDKIAQLEAQIKRSNTTAQARKVLTDGGINVPDAVLEFVVSDDDEKTLDNVRALISYTQSIQSQVRDEFRKGATPSKTGKAIKPVTKEAFDKMTPMEQLTFGVKDPDLYNKLVNQ